MTSQTEPIVEAEVTDSRLNRVTKLLDKAQHILSMPKDTQTPELLTEADAINKRAAELIAKYGIDRAMLAASGHAVDRVVDEVIILDRPFAEKMRTLLWYIADPMGAKGRWVKRWDAQAGPKAKGGIPRGGWEYGMRIFAHESDMARIRLMYVSLRNQALVGMSKIVNNDTEFGQAQKADRESYLDGFANAVYYRITQAEREAKASRQAQEEEARDKAMLDGVAADSGPGVALVLADRKKAVAIAMDLADGITVADRARWAAQAKERTDARRKELDECAKCKAAKSGRCKAHKVSYGRSRPVYERKGTKYDAGWQAGQRADLTGHGPTSVSRDSGRSAIG